MEMKKENIARFWGPIVSIGFSLVITIGGWLMASKIQDALLEERLATMQRDMAKHEMEKSEQIRFNAIRADEHEKRIVRLEASFGMLQETLSEMKEDIKILVRGNRPR